MAATLYSPYSAFSVTATTTPQTLLSLLRGVDSTVSPRAREITIQADPSNTANIRIGQATGSSSVVSNTNCGYILVAGASRTYRATDYDNSAALPLMAIIAESGTAKLNVELVRS